MLPMTPFLRRVLLADAALSLAMGAVLAALSGPLAAFTGLPAGLLAGAGLFLIVSAPVLVVLARRTALPRSVAWLLVVACALWAIESAALPLLGLVQPNGAGFVLLAVQGAAVAVLGELYWLALRRAPRAA